MKNKNDLKVVLATIASAVSGAAIALLMAPEKGSELRNKISEGSDKYLKDFKKDITELRKSFDSKAKQSKSKIKKVDKKARKKGKDALGKDTQPNAYEDWTKDELYERAKEKDIENYSTMNKAELIEALRNH